MVALARFQLKIGKTLIQRVIVCNCVSAMSDALPLAIYIHAVGTVVAVGAETAALFHLLGQDQLPLRLQLKNLAAQGSLLCGSAISGGLLRWYFQFLFIEVLNIALSVVKVLLMWAL